MRNKKQTQPISFSTSDFFVEISNMPWIKLNDERFIRTQTEIIEVDFERGKQASPFFNWLLLFTKTHILHSNIYSEMIEMPLFESDS